MAQAARGIHGVTVGSDGALQVDPDALAAADPPASVIDGSSHAGLLAFLAAASGRRAPAKFQLTGPVTLGAALADAGAPPALAFEIAGNAARGAARTLLELVRRRLPDMQPIVFLDEPGLVRLRRGDLPLSPEEATDLVSSALAVLEEQAVTGVHCCGPADWRVPRDAGAVILSVPVERDHLPDAGVLARHLDNGGWIAWGAVPTTGPVGSDADRLWRRLVEVWTELVDGGCAPELLRARALVTPACGLAGHGLSQAAGAMRLAARLGERVADLASRARPARTS